VNISAVGLDNFAKSENYGARQIKRWTEQYKSSIDTKIPSMEKLIKWLPNNLPPENYRKLLLLY
jgi:aminoglycoside phosphotransferase (APT) family kinase protein